MTRNKHNQMNGSFGIYADLDTAFEVSETMSEFENRVKKNNPQPECYARLSSPNRDVYLEKDDNFAFYISPESEDQINQNVDELLRSNKEYLNYGNTSDPKGTQSAHPPNYHVEPFQTNNNVCISKTVFIVALIILLIIGIYFLAKNSANNATIKSNTFSENFLDF